MYTTFYNLTRKPFQISSDPSFMWFGEKHREALATLKYGILDNKGFLLLTGDVGTGKTTLINTLIQSLSDDVICTSVPDPGLEKLDFFNYIAAAFGMDHEFTTKGTFLAHFRRFLLQANENNKKVLLIIDEAQLLTQEMLEEIRLLSNIEKTDAKLINIFFIGQNEFNEILNREQNRAVRQRLTLNYNIDPLTPDETGEYIRHRLSVAGATEPVFDESAIQEVFMYSGGFPRRINVICDHSLLSGYVSEQKMITDAIVKECAKELKIPSYIRNRDINGFADYQDRPLPAAGQPDHRPRPVKASRKKVSFFLTGLVCLMIVFFAWFFMFPNNYADSMAGMGYKIGEVKDRFLQIIPEPYGSFLKQKDPLKEDRRTDEKKEAATKKTTIGAKKNDPDPIIVVPVSQEKIRPIQEESLKEDEVRHLILPQNDVVSKRVEEKKGETPQPLETVKEELLLEDPLPKKNILALPKEKVVIRFKYNTNDFTQEGFLKLGSFADIFSTHPESKILISGYTDSAGYEKYNRKLSEFRANIVRSFLLGRGIRADQIKILGLGSQDPIESNETAWGRMMNRRVEIKIIQDQ